MRSENLRRRDRKRNLVARRYDGFAGSNRIKITVARGVTSTWAVLQVSTRPVQAGLKAAVPTMVYYPIPLSRQPAYAHYPSAHARRGLERPW
jgi:dTDP-4-amino-4,6-dideoxygalactose transaminase